MNACSKIVKIKHKTTIQTFAKKIKCHLSTLVHKEADNSNTNYIPVSTSEIIPQKELILNYCLFDFI